MNLLGKILTGVILVMSLVFATVAMMVGATQKNWKAEKERIEQLVQSEEEKSKSLKDELAAAKQRLRQHVVSRAKAIQALNSQALRLAAQVKSQEEKLAAKFQEAQGYLANLTTTNARIKEQDQQIKDLMANNASMTNKLAAELKKTTALTSQVDQLTGRAQLLKERREQLEGLLATATRVMAANNLDFESATKHIAPANLVGKIIEADRRKVVISHGKDSGLRKGHQLDVTRSNKFVGRVEITEVQEKRSIAKVLPELSQTAVKANDQVITYNAPKG